MIKIKSIKSANKALKKLEDIVKRMKNAPSVFVGIPKGTNNYPDGTSTIMVGAVHEFGSDARGIPQRSYLRTTINEKRDSYKPFFAKAGKGVFVNRAKQTQAMNLLGLKVQSDVRQKITDIKEPPLSARTIEARIAKHGVKGQNANPLIDTGHLRQSIHYEVRID